ncbi:unnamed protein product [Candidula unifasciata]|uniref:Uncharacterized protein n=1 Tax=Candidula unifasciata TaxID=100452 RepID=A0A8S3YKY6_9EUPU|nr:unnamed protein product [Candidula unifasciata]
MSKTILRGKPSVLLINASIVEATETGEHFLLINNNTLIQVQLQEPYRDSQLNELLYVIIVIVFYATALMTLIITQIKRQRREGTEVDYYDEYLQRNSEVKQTCQTATSIVSRQAHPPPALATAAFAAAAAGTLLGRVPLIHDDATDNLLNESGVGEFADSNSGDGVRAGMGGGSGGSFGSRILYPRDKSPMLESIPDEEG